MKNIAYRLGIAASVFLVCGCDTPKSSSNLNIIPPTKDTSRDIISTNLELDVTAQVGAATIVLSPSSSKGASFEVQGLTIESVLSPQSAFRVQYAVTDGRLDLGLPATSIPIELHIQYTYKTQTNFNGSLKEQLSFLWPHSCGNLFPCNSNPSEGSTFTMALYGIPMNDTAVYPAEIPADAPAYMPAFAIEDYTYISLGKTAAGTDVGVYQLPGDEAAVQAGTKDLTAFFDWFEKTYGEYTFGTKVASVSANWAPGSFRGMEHHPYWHVARDAMNDPVTHAREAAHGWFGNGVRMACWEDYVLSAGTATYLAARAVEAVGGPNAAQAVWDSYQIELDKALAAGDTILMLDTCNEIDLASHPLRSNVTSMKGAYFYKAVETQVGKDKLDAALKKFYETHKNKAARMQDLITMIQSDTGADISMHVNGWLKGLGKP